MRIKPLLTPGDQKMTSRNEGSEARPAGAPAGAVEGPGEKAPSIKVRDIEIEPDRMIIKTNIEDEGVTVTTVIVYHNGVASLMLDKVVKEATEWAVSVLEEAKETINNIISDARELATKQGAKIVIDSESLAAAIAKILDGRRITEGVASTYTMKVDNEYFDIEIILSVNKDVEITPP